MQCSWQNVPLNVSAMTFNKSASTLVMGTRDGVLYSYALDSTSVNQLAEKARAQTKDAVRRKMHMRSCK
jgi:hypothetical protein